MSVSYGAFWNEENRSPLSLLVFFSFGNKLGYHGHAIFSSSQGDGRTGGLILERIKIKKNSCAFQKTLFLGPHRRRCAHSYTIRTLRMLFVHRNTLYAVHTMHSAHRSECTEQCELTEIRQISRNWPFRFQIQIKPFKLQKSGSQMLKSIWIVWKAVQVLKCL